MHAEVLMKIERSNILKKPTPIKMPYMFKSKHFWYHKDHEHDMVECIKVKKVIEALIQRSKL